MSELAIQILNQPFVCVETYREAAIRERAKPANKIPSTEILFLGALLMTLQILDGALTAMGVSAFGVAAEGNPFIQQLMVLIGHLPALILVKGIAVVIIGYMCTLANQIVWLPGAMKGLICVYMCAAIIPWSAILLTNLV